jgi:hypothetical protein
MVCSTQLQSEVACTLSPEIPAVKMKTMRLPIQTVSSRASVDVILSLSAHTLCFEWFVSTQLQSEVACTLYPEIPAVKVK